MLNLISIVLIMALILTTLFSCVAISMFVAYVHPKVYLRDMYDSYLKRDTDEQRDNGNGKRAIARGGY